MESDNWGRFPSGRGATDERRIWSGRFLAKATLLLVLFVGHLLPGYVMAAGDGEYPELVIASHFRPELTIGLEARGLVGPKGAYSSFGARVGYTGQLGVSLGRKAHLLLRASIFPTTMRFDTMPGCVPNAYEGEGEPSAQQISSAMACYPTRGSHYFGVGLGRRVRLGPRLTVSEAIFVDGAFLPDTVIPSDSDAVGGLAVADVMAVGPVSRARFAYAIIDRSVELNFGIELTAGVMGIWSESALQLSVPLGLLAGVGVTY